MRRGVLVAAALTGLAASAAVAVAQIGRDPAPEAGDEAATETAIVAACRTSIIAAARPLYAVAVDVVGVGPPEQGADGVLSTPLEVRIVYAQGAERDVRRSRVTCRVDPQGRVVALDDGASRRLAVVPEPPPPQPPAPQPSPPRAADGGAVVDAFYRALRAGDGTAASLMVIPEKRGAGPLSAGEITRYFGSLARDLRTHGIARIGADRFGVDYSYAIGSRVCIGSAVVRLTYRGPEPLIESIDATEDCS